MPLSDQGVSTNRYCLIPRTLSFLFSGKNVLLIKGSATKRLWANLYNGIGGHVERGEDVVSAAVREFYEETGLVVKDFRLCGVVTIDTGPETGVCIYIFRGETFSGELRSSEEGSLEWIDLENLGKLPLVEDLVTLIPRILISERSREPFSAHYQYVDGRELKISFHNPGHG